MGHRVSSGWWSQDQQGEPGHPACMPTQPVADGSSQDCRKRWFHSLDPSLRKGKWTEEEDRKLRQLYAELGPQWKEIGRSPLCHIVWVLADSKPCAYPAGKTTKYRNDGAMSCVPSSHRKSHGPHSKTPSSFSYIRVSDRNGPSSRNISRGGVPSRAGTGHGGSRSSSPGSPDVSVQWSPRVKADCDSRAPV